MSIDTEAALISKIENELGRELSTLEKVAWVGAVGRIGLSAAKAVKNVLPKNLGDRAQNWGKAIGTSYERSKSQNLSGYDTARRVLGGAMKQDPVLTTGTLAGAGFTAGGKSKKNSVKLPMIPMMPANAYFETIELEKKAQKEKEKSDKWLYAGAGAAGGVLLGMRNKRILAKLKEAELLDKTKTIREIGDALGKKYTGLKVTKEQEFNDLFKDISDLKQRETVKNITTDVDRVINELGKNVPKGVRREDINKEIHELINKVQDSGELSPSVVNYLRESVDYRFRTGLGTGTAPSRTRFNPHNVHDDFFTPVRIEEFLNHLGK